MSVDTTAWSWCAHCSRTCLQRWLGHTTRVAFERKVFYKDAAHYE